MKWVLTILAIMILIAGLVVGFIGHIEVMITAFFGFVGLLFAANLDRVSEFKASGSGIEAKTREVIARAESTLSELQLLARNIGELTLSLVKRSGRIGGYGDGEQEEIKKSVIDVLKKIGIPESEFPKVLRDWNRFIEFDYSHAILGGNIIPQTDDKVILSELNALRKGGIDRIPSPKEIRQFLNKHGFMTEELDEYLKDYVHFCTYENHRRPEVWSQREQWGILKKP